jgi:hypothetical protein
LGAHDINRAFYFSALFHHSDVVKVLLESGMVDLNWIGWSGGPTLLEMTREEGFDDLIERFVDLKNIDT